MLILSESSLFVFIKFLQILLWISLPAIIVGMLVTTIIHYNKKRRKAKKKAGGEAVDDDMTPVFFLPDVVDLPASVTSTNKLMHQISYSNAKIIALQKDLDELQERYQSLLTDNGRTSSENSKNDFMEKLQRELQQTLQEQIDSLKHQYEFEKTELQENVKELNATIRNLEHDNRVLHEQLAAYSSDNTEAAVVIQRWEDEKYELKKRISEQAYLMEVLEEKKLQIEFLQNQLEQRVKNYCQVEQQFKELGLKFMAVKEELEIKQQQDQQFQSVIDGKDMEIRSLQDIIVAKSDHIKELENSMTHFGEQNAKFAAELAAKEETIINLQKQLEEACELHNQTKERLEKNQQLFKGFHRKLSDILDDEVSGSPVIVMKPMYQQTNENDQFSETAVQ